MKYEKKNVLKILLTNLFFIFPHLFLLNKIKYTLFLYILKLHNITNFLLIKGILFFLFFLFPIFKTNN